MITFILNIIFWSVLFFCGWQVSRFVFKEKKIEVLLPLSFVIGVSIYLFLLNLSSYFIPITTNFYLVLGFLLLVSLFLFILRRSRKIERLEWGINKRGVVLVFATTLIIMILIGLVSARILGGDELSQYHLPSAASIAGGNFPVKELNMPENYQAYHYAPNLLFAAIFKITNLPIWFASDLTTFLFSGVIFLLCFLLARLIIKHNIKAFLVALVAVLAGGFRFIYIIPGLKTLFQHFVLQENIAHPFKFLAFVWDARPLLTNSLPNLLLDIWAPLGWALFLTLIFICLNYLPRTDISRYSKVILMVICLSILALTIETSFVIICLVLLVYPFILFFKQKNKSRLKYLIICSLLVLIMTAILVLIQGGTITVILRNILEKKPSLGQPMIPSFFNHPWAFLSNGQLLPFYSKDFLMNFGLVYLLIIPASIFILRHYFKKGLFLILISFSSFVIPFLISFNLFWQDTVNRLFYSVNFIWALMVAIFLLAIRDCFKKSKFIKNYLIFFLLIIICLDGFVFLLSRPFYAQLFPTIHEDSFLARLKKPSPIEVKAYSWVRRNTTIKDYFLTFDNIDEVGNKFPIAQTYRFVFYTQRLAPIYLEGGHNYIATPNPKNPSSFKYKEVIKTCNQDILKELKYKYLFVNNNWPVGLEEKCLADNDLKLELEVVEDDSFTRIYEVIYEK